MTGELVPLDAGDDLAPRAGALDLAIAAWLDAKGGRGSARTLEAYRDTLGAFRAALQAAGLDLDADPRAVALALQGWAGQRTPGAQREGQPVKPSTFNQRVACVSSFYRYAVRWGLAERNPAELVERAKVHAYNEAEALDPRTVRARLEAIDRSTPTGQRDYALLSAALVTGRRLGEIGAWRWGDLHIGPDGLVTLTTRHAKGDKVMRDTLPRRVSAALLAWLHSHYGARLGDLAPDAPLWPNLARNATADAPLTRHGIDDLVRERLGVHPHALRHTFARSMEDSGAKVSDIQARLGHESLATTGRYLAALRRESNPHADDLERLFLGDAAP